MALANYSIILIQNRPELRLTIPFRASRRVADEAFSRMAFAFNASPFDKIYLWEHNYKNTRSIMLNLAYLRGVYNG